MADQILQEIKDRLNIAEVIGSYIQLKKAGANFKANCPFHNEKTPSFVVTPSRQIWHCFGCGEGGDVLEFVKKYENLDFPQTVKLLADRAGVKLPDYKPKDPQQEDERQLLYRINTFAAKYYHQILTKQAEGKEALNYLINRGLTEGTIKQWQIGFAPEDFHNLEKALAQKKVSTTDLVKAGVSAKNERGQIYDRFRGRITFPIFDYSGEVMGFSARILHDSDKSAKYINSPETAIYSKSKVVFGLNFAKNEIRKKDEAVLVEGQMDCIAAHQAGFSNTVATSGTALTQEQLNILGRLTKNLKFCFDADTAGQAASRRGGELAIKQGFRLKIIVLKKVKDPDELIKKSPSLWAKAVEEAEWFLDYQMNNAQTKFASDLVEQKHYLTKEVLPLISFIQDPLEQDHYIRQLVEKFNISERVVREQIKQYVGGKSIPESKISTTSEAEKHLPLEKEVLGAMLVYEDFFERLKQEGSLNDFNSRGVQEILAPAFVTEANRSALSQESSLAKEAIFVVESQLDNLEGDVEVLKRQLAKSFATLRLNSIKREQKIISAEMKKAESAGNKPQVLELNKKFSELMEKRMQYEGQV